MGAERVLDGKVVQPELPLYRAQQFLARLIEADPDEVPGLVREGPAGRDIEIGDSTAALISGPGYDHAHLPELLVAG
jgi:hypothetical protein